MSGYNADPKPSQAGRHEIKFLLRGAEFQFRSSLVHHQVVNGQVFLLVMDLQFESIRQERLKHLPEDFH